ncbi:hypothetical protein SISSUDRAFT_1128167 [Sistotremastrum suecicum HHB10207 ss-3]|uniref:Protein prenylyltransferase n=1 Tax=Sistotremastrum suecicum HHB10207 ss-3 TaxID=1314776 RepID=A0A166E9M9_9AGAM|nr:hypothetical protein SISSUDRAFT_1128167 [Sistotremastrum suecicum HHB10207 ss-3]
MNTIHKLAQILKQSVSSLDILPGSGSDWSSPDTNPHYPILFESGNLGIPEKELRKAYLVAVKNFARILPEGKTEDAVLDLTSVILLANPAHNTAFNIRKKLLSRHPLQSPVTELALTRLLFQTRDGAKSSLLWHHRRYFLRMQHYAAERYSSSSIMADEVPPLTVTQFEEEFALATRACEVYPRSYFAWLHRTKCLQSLNAIITTESAISQYMDLLLDERIRTRSWIESHIGDHSAVHYLCEIDKVLINLVSARPSLLDQNAKLAVHATLSTSLPHAEELLFSYPDHETTWAYYRGIVILHRGLEESDGESGAEGTVQVDRRELIRDVVEETRQSTPISSSSAHNKPTSIVLASRAYVFLSYAVYVAFRLGANYQSGGDPA